MYKERLVELRTDSNYNQKLFAKEMGFEISTYNNNETEYEIITLTNLNSVCNFFNVSLDYIFNFTDIRNYANMRKSIDIKLSSLRLKEFRKDNNLKQEALAKDLGCSQSIISRYEKGKNILPTQYVYAICSKYKISADYLLGKIDKPYKY